MSRMIPAAERLLKARALIQKARELQPPAGLGKNDFGYIAEVKDLLCQAKDLIKFIPKSPMATPEMIQEVKMLFMEIENADREILLGK